MKTISSDIQELITYFQSTVKYLLFKQERFDTFGAHVDLEGKLIPITVYHVDDLDAGMTLSESLLRYYGNELTEKKIRAFGITTDTRIVTNVVTKAISVLVGHMDDTDTTTYIFTYKVVDNRIDFIDSWTE